MLILYINIIINIIFFGLILLFSKISNQSFIQISYHALGYMAANCCFRYFWKIHHLFDNNVTNDNILILKILILFLKINMKSAS